MDTYEASMTIRRRFNDEYVIVFVRRFNDEYVWMLMNTYEYRWILTKLMNHYQYRRVLKNNNECLLDTSNQKMDYKIEKLKKLWLQFVIMLIVLQLW